MNGILCLGTNRDGGLCSRKANKDTGYCTHHEPQAVKIAETKQREKNRMEAEAARFREEAQQHKEERVETYIASGGRLRDIKQKIMDIKDLESLRQASLAVITGIIDEVIDSKAASSLAQLLKHQAELLEKTKPKEELLDNSGRDRLIEIAIKMPTSEAWRLMQDFTGGMAKLAKQAKAITMNPQEDVIIDVRPSENTDNERSGGVQTPDCDPGEIF